MLGMKYKPLLIGLLFAGTLTFPDVVPALGPGTSGSGPGPIESFIKSQQQPQETPPPEGPRHYVGPRYRGPPPPPPPRQTTPEEKQAEATRRDTELPEPSLATPPIRLGGTQAPAPRSPAIEVEEKSISSVTSSPLTGQRARQQVTKITEETRTLPPGTIQDRILPASQRSLTSKKEIQGVVTTTPRTGGVTTTSQRRVTSVRSQVRTGPGFRLTPQAKARYIKTGRFAPRTRSSPHF